MTKVIVLKKDNGMVAIVYPCESARGITLIPGQDEIPAVPAFEEVQQSKTTPYQPARDAIPAVPAVPPSVMGADGVIIPGLTQVESEDDFLNRIASGLPQGMQFMIVDNSTLPNADSDFFEAWKYGPAVTIDLPTAKDIQRVKLQAIRQPVLDALDIAYQIADETNDTATKAVIIAKKTGSARCNQLPGTSIGNNYNSNSKRRS